jgi:L-fucose isomerase-like protein
MEPLTVWENASASAATAQAWLRQRSVYVRQKNAARSLGRHAAPLTMRPQRRAR